VACTQCHAAEQSTRTADIILPSQKTCVECHSPKGGVRDACSTCHNYHNEPSTGMTVAAAGNPQP
jgi:predicted CXXCH cytochrome family protein